MTQHQTKNERRANTLANTNAISPDVQQLLSVLVRVARRIAEDKVAKERAQ